jgi:hypothetical protein
MVARFFLAQNPKYQDFPLQDPPKFTQIVIFGLKTNHLATLPGTKKCSKNGRKLGM